jgi:hypothetical protein
MTQSDDDLLAQIREKVFTGRLPKEHCRMTWFGPGRGGRCAACEQPIGPQDLEVECDLPRGGSIPFHRRCYDAWTELWPTMA